MMARLSEREREVLFLVSHGFSNAEVGVKLHLSEDTVKTHMRRIFQRLKARDRAHAVRRGFEAGVLALAVSPSRIPVGEDVKPDSALVGLARALEALGWHPPAEVPQLPGRRAS